MIGNYVGETCIIRAYRAGVFFGEIRGLNGSSVTLDECIRIHYWAGACSLSQLATCGTSKPEDCRFSVTTNNHTIMDVIEIIPCTEKAINSIRGVKTWRL